MALHFWSVLRHHTSNHCPVDLFSKSHALGDSSYFLFAHARPTLNNHSYLSLVIVFCNAFCSLSYSLIQLECRILFSSTYGHKPCLEFFHTVYQTFFHHHVCVFCQSFARLLLLNHFMHGFASTVPLAYHSSGASMVLNLFRSLLCRNGYGHQTWWSPWRRPPYSRAIITFHTQRRKRGQPCVKLATSRTLKERWEPHPNKSPLKPRPNDHEPWAIAAAPHHTKHNSHKYQKRRGLTQKQAQNSSCMIFFNLNIHRNVALNLKRNRPYTESGKREEAGKESEASKFSDTIEVESSDLISTTNDVGRYKHRSSHIILCVSLRAPLRTDSTAGATSI